jgi:hypothetical protein
VVARTVSTVLPGRSTERVFAAFLGAEEFSYGRLLR